MSKLCRWQCLLCFNNPFSYSATGNFFPQRLNEEMISGEALKQSRNGWLRGQDGSPSCQLNTTGMDWKDKSGTRKVLIQLQRYCRSSSKKQRLFGLCTYINHHPPPRISTFTTSLKGQHQILPCVFLSARGVTSLPLLWTFSQEFLIKGPYMLRIKGGTTLFGQFLFARRS